MPSAEGKPQHEGQPATLHDVAAYLAGLFDGEAYISVQYGFVSGRYDRWQLSIGRRSRAERLAPGVA